MFFFWIVLRLLRNTWKSSYIKWINLHILEIKQQKIQDIQHLQQNVLRQTDIHSKSCKLLDASKNINKKYPNIEIIKIKQIEYRAGS